MKLDIKARLVAAICQFKAEHDIRYYLNGVYVEPIPHGIGVLIVATNGHTMGIWRDTTGHIDRPAILRIDKQLQSACTGSDLKRLIISDDRLAVVIEQPSTTTEVFIQAKEDHMKTNNWEVPGKFPDWKRVVVTEGSPQLLDCINPGYVAMFDKAITIGAGSEKWCNGINFHQSGRNQSILATSMRAPDFVCVIMPMREDRQEVPKWIAELKAEVLRQDAIAALPLPGQQPSDAAPMEGGAP